MKASQLPEKPPAARRAAGAGKPSPEAFSELWPGMPWMMGPWLKFWQDVWAGWLGGGFLAESAGTRHKGETERRQEEGLPWLPKVETTVIPLRRRTDPPGQQAARISMRVRVPSLPWLSGGNVIAIDTVLPRGPDGEAEPPPAKPSDSKKDWR